MLQNRTLTATLGICLSLGGAVCADWKDDWEVSPGFSMSIDATGFRFPSSIAFVPHPGPNPQDPLYFVTELRGTLKVVTNDRTVHVFADRFFELDPERELPYTEGEVGLVSVCLEPENGYVFVSYAYQDEKGLLRNNVMRFDTVPQTFAIKPTGRVSFSHIFAHHLSAVSHQIGRLMVKNGLLYVGVGDGEVPHESQNLRSPLGKLLRMTLDGKPVTDNPFYYDDDVTAAMNYVWASGLRNPFGLATTRDRVFVADNGLRMDRFLEVREGENCEWDGENWSIGAHADIVFGPAVSPVQMEFLEADNEVFPPAWRDMFYVAFCGDANAPPGPGRFGAKSLAIIDYDFDTNTARSVPRQFVRFRGEGHQIPVGLAFGPDGLYFTPLYPTHDDTSVIFKVSYDPANEHPHVLNRNTPPLALMHSKGCFSCHSLTSTAEGTQGPSLERRGLAKRIAAKLESPEYRDRVAAMQTLEEEPFVSFRAARTEVLAAQGQERVLLWARYHLLEPRFDNPMAKMPQFRLTDGEASSITDFLLEPQSGVDTPGLLSRIKNAIGKVMPESRTGVSMVFFGFGFCCALVGGVVPLYLRSRRSIRAGRRTGRARTPAARSRSN